MTRTNMGMRFRTLRDVLFKLAMVVVLMKASSVAQAQPSNFPRPDFPVPDGAILSLLATNGIIYLAGDFETVGDRARPYLAALDVQNGRLLNWEPDTEGPVSAAALSGKTLYVGIRIVNSRATNAVDAFDVQTAQRPAAWAGYIRTIAIEGSITCVNTVAIGHDLVYRVAR